MMIDKIKEFVNLKWLGWTLVLFLMLTVFYGFKNAAYWTSAFTLFSIYSYNLYNFIDGIVYDKLLKINEGERELKDYFTEALYIIFSAFILLILVSKKVIVVFMLSSILFIILTIHFISWFSDRKI